MTFQEKLVILRKSKGLTQDEFASAVGVSRQAVYKWESGQSYPEVPKLIEMKHLFGISIDDLLDDNYEVIIPEKKKRKRRVNPDAKAPVAKTEATPAPVAEPVVEEVPAPAAEPVVEAAPAPVAEPVVEEVPAPVAEPVAEEVPAPAAEPVAEEIPAPVFESVKETSVEEIPAPTFEPAEEPVVEAAPAPSADAATEEKKKGGFFGKLFGRK